MEKPDQFSWPEGKRFAVSITFDDGRHSQLEIGIPIMDRYGVRGTFYCCPREVEARAVDWRSVSERGHEIGNHSNTHPCSGNFTWLSRNAALEEYTVDQIRADLIEAGDRIEAAIGTRPITFAYPCGQTWVGRGANVRSYVPVAAELFIGARGFRNEYWNDPGFCDLAQLAGAEFDGMSDLDLAVVLNACSAAGGWLILAGHDIGNAGIQMVETSVLEHLCALAASESSEMWCAPTAEIAKYVGGGRGAPSPPRPSATPP